MEINGETSDGFHTFNELYEARLLLTANLFNAWAENHWDWPEVRKSKLHSDGTVPFGDPNWFIVTAQLPQGQISFHYEMKDWDLFFIRESEKAPAYDGHTSADVMKRLRAFCG